jgi:hypothetical protein
MRQGVIGISPGRGHQDFTVNLTRKEERSILLIRGYEIPSIVTPAVSAIRMILPVSLAQGAFRRRALDQKFIISVAKVLTRRIAWNHYRAHFTGLRRTKFERVSGSDLKGDC